MPGTLAAALKLHPRTRQLVLVGGASELDKIFHQMGREAVQPYEGRLEVKFLIDLPIEEILTEVTHLPPETLVLFLNFHGDSQGIVYIPSQALSRISLAANAPIYGLWETLLGNGIVGGHLVNFESQAIRAGELGRRVLAGENPIGWL